jgi:protoheme IX farnesyltransferase
MIAERSQVTWLIKLLAYVELTKPRIAVMVLLTVLTACSLGTAGLAASPLVAWTILGTALIASSASAANQWLERSLDLRMERTKNRPLPAAILSEFEVLSFLMLTLFAGLAILLWQVNWQSAVWGLLTWISYVIIYTPMKTASTANTAVGAVAGAMPVLIAWAAIETPVDLSVASVRLMTLFLVLYLWQFPHFMAIAWLYRHDYRSSDMQMLTVTDPTGQAAGRLSVRTAIILMGISLLPFWQMGQLLPGMLSLGLGLSYLWLSWKFQESPTELTARRLLRGSLLYLPLWMLLLWLAPQYKDLF